MPKPGARASGTTAGKSTGPVSGTTPSGATRRIPPDRKTVIPKRFSLAIAQPRINRIYHELQKLNLEQFVNCCAVMFRVFVELSLDDFAQRHHIPLKAMPKPKSSRSGSTSVSSKDMTLRQKLSTVADYLTANDLLTKAQLRGVRALLSNRDHVLSVDSLNAYVHNKDYSPTPADLKNKWDNLQVFIERIWTI